MSYKIVLVKSAVKELKNLPPKLHDRVIDHLRQLEGNPRLFGAEKLTAHEAYKLRVGSYRIVYQIDDNAKEVKVLMVEDRKQVYKRLKRR